MAVQTDCELPSLFFLRPFFRVNHANRTDGVRTASETMDRHYPSSTKRVGIPNPLDWETGDRKRARLGLGADFSDLGAAPSCDPFQPDELADSGISSGIRFPVVDDSSGVSDDVWMSDPHTPPAHHVVGFDHNWQLPEPEVEMVCFGVVGRISLP